MWLGWNEQNCVKELCNYEQTEEKHGQSCAIMNVIQLELKESCVIIAECGNKCQGGLSDPNQW
jgi:hypothetical protein